MEVLSLWTRRGYTIANSDSGALKPSRGILIYWSDAIVESWKYWYEIYAYHRMRKSRLLLIGVNGLANEVAKNLVLAGIGRLTLADGQTVKAQDLGAQFFLRESDIGKNVCSTQFCHSVDLNLMLVVESRGCDGSRGSSQSRRIRQCRRVGRF